MHMIYKNLFVYFFHSDEHLYKNACFICARSEITNHIIEPIIGVGRSRETVYRVVWLEIYV